MKEVSFKSTDETLLDGILYEASYPKSVTIIHGATGVPYHYYRHFAEWLCKTKASNVLIYGYRDSGLKSGAALRKSKTTMADWGLKDQSAALDYMLTSYPDLPLHTIGHSLGGFCIPYHEQNDKIVSHTGVNSGAAYAWAHPWKFMPQIILFWYILGPLLTNILGYLPGQLLGMKTHIPKEAYWQWRKWCTQEKFYQPEWGKTLPKPDITRFTGKLRLITCEDDQIIPPKRVEYIMRFFPSAKETDFKVLKPKHYGLKSIGHIAIFSKAKSKLWPDLITE